MDQHIERQAGQIRRNQPVRRRLVFPNPPFRVINQNNFNFIGRMQRARRNIFDNQQIEAADRNIENAPENVANTPPLAYLALPIEHLAIREENPVEEEAAIEREVQHVLQQHFARMAEVPEEAEENQDNVDERERPSPAQ